MTREILTEACDHVFEHDDWERTCSRCGDSFRKLLADLMADNRDLRSSLGELILIADGVAAFDGRAIGKMVDRACALVEKKVRTVPP